MSAESIMASWAARQGWNVDTQLALALRYIDQHGDAAFADFLAQVAASENQTRRLREVPEGWQRVIQYNPAIYEDAKRWEADIAAGLYIPGDWLVIAYDADDCTIRAWVIEDRLEYEAAKEAKAEVACIGAADWGLSPIEVDDEEEYWLVVVYGTDGSRDYFVAAGPWDRARKEIDMEVSRMARVSWWRMIPIERD